MIAILIFIIIAIIMKYSKFGRSVYAIGGNAQSALMMGLNVRKTKFKAYMLDGFLAGMRRLPDCCLKQLLRIR